MDTVIDINKWLAENEKYFLPPVCNKLMHNDQLKVFFVGGPNQRKDYHIEEGEELFYMLKGDMCLKVLEGGQFKDIEIREGEVFLLPARIPHSPQRKKDTIGLVIERERVKDREWDALRYFVENSTDILFERWFYCDDLGTQLGPIIKEFFQSQEFKTGKPNSTSVNSNPPYLPDSSRQLMSPFALDSWLVENADSIATNGVKTLFEGDFQSQISIYGKGEHTLRNGNYETFLWQWQNEGRVVSSSANVAIKQGNSFLLSPNNSCSLSNTDGFTLAIAMPPIAI